MTIAIHIRAINNKKKSCDIVAYIENFSFLRGVPSQIKISIGKILSWDIIFNFSNLYWKV